MYNNSYYNQGYVAGVAEALDSADISYTYHIHIVPDSGSLINYNEKTLYNVSGGCYTEPVNKLIPIYGPCDGKITETKINHLEYKHECDKCGFLWYGGCDGNCGSICTRAGAIIGNKTEFVGYGTSCGKTKESIESATIIFD